MARAKKVTEQTADAVLATETAPTPSERKYSDADMVLINQFAAALLSSMEPHRAQEEVVQLRIRKAFEVAIIAAGVSKELAQETTA